jgi:hypothetical protein
MAREYLAVCQLSVLGYLLGKVIPRGHALVGEVIYA